MASQPLSFEDTSRFAQLGDLRLHYNEAGEGEVLVMLHGSGPGATGWSNFKQNLPAFAERFRVLVVDRLSLTMGYAGVYSSFLKHAFSQAERFGVSPVDILMRAGERKLVGGQEDQLIDIARELERDVAQHQD